MRKGPFTPEAQAIAQVGVSLEGGPAPSPLTHHFPCPAETQPGCKPPKRKGGPDGDAALLAARGPLLPAHLSQSSQCHHGPLSNRGHYHHRLPPPQLPALGIGSEVKAATSLAGRTRPGGCPGRAGDSRASSATLASTYSRDTRDTRDSRLIEGLTSPGTGGIRV